mgnify:CR=1 FL=1
MPQTETEELKHLLSDCIQEPEEHELAAIRAWTPWRDGEPGDCPSDQWVGWHDLLNYVRARWTCVNAEYWTEYGPLIRAATAGLSGNESLIQALRANPLFWSQCHVLSLCGGLYLFDLDDGVGGPLGDLYPALMTAIGDVIRRYQHLGNSSRSLLGELRCATEWPRTIGRD